MSLIRKYGLNLAKSVVYFLTTPIDGVNETMISVRVVIPIPCATFLEPSQFPIKTVMLMPFVTGFYCDNFITGFFITCFITLFECNHVIKTSQDSTKLSVTTVKNCHVFVTAFVITCHVTVFECNHVIKMSHVFITSFQCIHDSHFVAGVAGNVSVLQTVQTVTNPVIWHRC